jgi:prevent-host-death family protein
MNNISASQFKAKCLKLIDEVAATRKPLIITKRGKPLAKLVPIEDEKLTPLFGYMKGTVAILGDIAVSEWVERALDRPDIRLIGLEHAITVIDSCRLPGDFHPDPADRLLMATARRENAVLVTHDRKILDYGSAGHVRVMAA